MKNKKLFSVIMAIAFAFCAFAFVGCNENKQGFIITFDYGNGSGIVRTLEIGEDLIIPNLPSPTTVPDGMSFGGWKDSADNFIKPGEKYEYNKDITVKAYYKSVSYTITYDVNGGNRLDETAVKSYTVSDTPIRLPVTEKRGYDFVGWRVEGGDIITEIPAGTASDLNLTAVYSVKNYTIQFDYNGGTGTENSRKVNFDTVLSDLPVPVSPAGYTFKGWQDESGKIVMNGMAFTYYNNVVFTAVYEQIVYTVSYDFNGGTIVGDIIETYVLSDSDTELPTAVRNNYEFIGWKTADNEVITKIAAGTVGDLDLTAEWLGKNITITFDYNGGAGDERSRTVVYGNGIGTLPSPTECPSGLKFVGWYDENGKSVRADTVALYDEDVVFVAHYGMFDYSINYVTGGVDLPNDAILVYNVSDEDIALPVLSREHYEFIGWKTADDEVITFIAAGTVGDLYLTAEWQGETIIITFDYNGGTGDEPCRTVVYGELIGTLPVPEAESGHTFIGWYDEDGNKVSDTAVMYYSADVTFTARYSLVGYSITYDLNGGDFAGEYFTAFDLTDANKDLPVAEKTGYEFIGWNVSGTEETITAIPSDNLGDLSLIAVYVANVYTVTFDYNGGTGDVEEKEIEYDSTITDLPAPETCPTGTEFDYWADEDGNEVTNGDVMKYTGDGAITFTAVYKYIEYTITYNLNDGSFGDEYFTTYTVADGGKQLPVPTLSGYMFSGWRFGQELITAIPENATGDMELSAEYEQVQKQYTIIFNNASRSYITDWADGTEGTKEITVAYGEVINIPAIKFDNMSAKEKSETTYTMEAGYGRWYYLDSTNKKVTFNVCEFTVENFTDINFDTLETLTIYVQPFLQWAGPY